MTTPAPQHCRLIAGDHIPFTPRELLDAGFEPGSVPTADRVNALLDRLRAENGSELPAHVQARLDAMARGEAPNPSAEWRPSVTTPTDPPRCVGCARLIKRVGLFWRDWDGTRTCAYRYAGLGLHKPGQRQPFGEHA